MALPNQNDLRASLNWNEASSRLSPTPGVFARENLVYVQEAGYFETEPGYFTERDELDSLLLMLTIGGEGQLEYRGQFWPVKANDLVWIDCREHHLYRTDPNALWKFFWVHLTGANSRAYYGYFNEMLNGKPVLGLSDPDALTSLFRDLIASQNNHGLQAEFRTAQLLVGLMTEAVLGSQSQTNAKIALHPAVQDAITIIENQMNQRLNLDDLARQGKVSRFHLIKLFVKQTGLTPMVYLQQVRISEAKRLLHLTDWTIERIAEAVGLIPASYLIQVFRQLEGVTPGQYRKRWIK
jgi:AraC-like DNA-binding protein